MDQLVLLSLSLSYTIKGHQLLFKHMLNLIWNIFRGWCWNWEAVWVFIWKWMLCGFFIYGVPCYLCSVEWWQIPEESKRTGQTLASRKGCFVSSPIYLHRCRSHARWFLRELFCASEATFIWGSLWVLMPQCGYFSFIVLCTFVSSGCTMIFLPIWKKGGQTCTLEFAKFAYYDLLERGVLLVACHVWMDG